MNTKKWLVCLLIALLAAMPIAYVIGLAEDVATGETTQSEPTPSEPTAAPTDEPTTAPTDAPTAEPTAAPTDAPTTAPTARPTAKPTTKPTDEPTTEPSAEPTAEPTAAPTTDNTTNTTNTTTKKTTSTVVTATAPVTLPATLMPETMSDAVSVVSTLMDKIAEIETDPNATIAIAGTKEILTGDEFTRMSTLPAKEQLMVTLMSIGMEDLVKTATASLGIELSADCQALMSDISSRMANMTDAEKAQLNALLATYFPYTMIQVGGVMVPCFTIELDVEVNGTVTTQIFSFYQAPTGEWVLQ